MNHSNDSEDDCAVNVESDIEQENAIEALEFPEQHDVRAAPIDPRLIRPKLKSERQADKVFVMVNAIEMRRNTGFKEM